MKLLPNIDEVTQYSDIGIRRRTCNSQFVSSTRVLALHHCVVVTRETKLFQKYLSLRRRPTEIILFQRVETCLNLFQNYFRSLLMQLTNIFQHVQCR